MNEAGDIIEQLRRRVNFLELKVASLEEGNKRFRHQLEILGFLPELQAESEEFNASTEMKGEDTVDATDKTLIKILETKFSGDSDYESGYSPDEEENPEDSDTESNANATIPLEEVKSLLMDVGYGNGWKVSRPWPNVIADRIMKMEFREKALSQDDDMAEENDEEKEGEGDLESESDVDATVPLQEVQHTTKFLDINFKDDSDPDDEYIPEENKSLESEGDSDSDTDTLIHPEEVISLKEEAGCGRVIPVTFGELLTREELDNYTLFNMKSLQMIEYMHEEGEDRGEEEEEEEEEEGEQEKVLEFNILDMDCEQDSESDVGADYDPNEDEEQSSGDESESEHISENENESESEEDEFTTFIPHERLDIALVISTTNISKKKAIKALEHNDNYIIKAIMHLHKTGQALTRQGHTIWPQPSPSEIKESLESYMSCYISLELLNLSHIENPLVSHLRLSPESPGGDGSKAADSSFLETQDIQDKQINGPILISDDDDTPSLVQISRAQSPASAVSTSWSVVSHSEEER